MAKRANSKEPPWSDRKRKAASNGQKTSEEYDRFESLVNRIVQVPKKEIDAERKREAARRRAAEKGS